MRCLILFFVTVCGLLFFTLPSAAPVTYKDCESWAEKVEAAKGLTPRNRQVIRAILKGGDLREYITVISYIQRKEIHDEPVVFDKALNECIRDLGIPSA